jgi:Family of unknown function (DUF5681)
MGISDMSEKSNPSRTEPPQSQSNESGSTAAEEYQVGPGRPPPDKRWKKGGPSPNPRGRPRKEQSMLPDVRKAFEQAVNKKVLVPLGDRKVLMTRVEIGLEQLLNQFAKGDRHARRDLMEYADKLGIDFLAKHRQDIEKAITPNHQAILDAFLARQSGAANIAPAPPVLAPPELLDDDAAEAEETVASPPTAVTNPEPVPEPEPPPKPGVKYPKPFHRMAWSEKRAWYPEWWAKKLEQEQEKDRAKEEAKAEAKERAAQKLDQASRGPGRPPPGGFSLTTGKAT